MRINVLTTALCAFVSGVQAQCHDYVIISTRGTGELQELPSIAFIRMINSTLTTVSGGIEYDTVYPAGRGTQRQGADDINRYINDGLKNCPHQKYALLGYSQGASATALALWEYANRYSAGYAAIKAILVVGNPQRKPGNYANRDENNGTSNKFMRGGSFTDDARQIADLWYAGEKLLDICFTGDIVCAPEQAGANIVPHVQYGISDSVQKLGAEFLIQQLS